MYRNLQIKKPGLKYFFLKSTLMKHYKLLLGIIFTCLITHDPCFSQYQAGDTLQFWSVTYNDWPPLWGAPQRQVNAICKNAGAHCYVFVEDSAAQPSQADIDTVVRRFDQHFYDSLTFRYGPVPNVFDNDPHVFILVMNEPDWSGYFDPGQQMSDSMVYATWNRHSNEREIIYVSANYFGSYSDRTVAHELGHMLHWLQDHSPEPIINPVQYWEDTWVDEGFSTFAAIYLTENINQHNIFDNAAFFANNPDKPLIYFSDYNQVKLFMLFMFEHYGRWNYISHLISNQLNGIAGVDSTLHDLGYSTNFDDAFEQWAIANYVDDSVYAGGKYSYAHYSFPACHISASYTSYPTSLNNATINPYAADYIKFSSSVANPIVIDFNGQANSRFRLDFVLKNSATNHIDSIIGVPLDNSNHASFIADELGTAYDQVIMIVINVDSTIHENNTASYSYVAGIYSGSEEIKKKNEPLVYPNPVKDKLTIELLDNLNSLITIDDMQGRTCLSKTFIKTTGFDISSLAKGMYILRIRNDAGSYTEKIIKE
jgi:hypothetical protein